MSKKPSRKPRSEQDPLEVRLDAVIRFLVESKNPKNKDGITEPEAARILNSVGLGPTDIAKILGKKSKTSVAAYLYGERE